MIRCLLIALCLCPLPGWAIDETPEVEAPDTTPEADDPQKLGELIDTLDQASLQEAFRLLTTDYINEEDLDSLEVNRSALQGLLSRLDFGAMLLTEKSIQDRNSKFLFHAEKINRTTAYLRFGRYTKKGVEELDETLKKFVSDENVSDLIVDLRSPQAQADFAIASEILSRFRPPNELLFKIRRPGADRPSLFVSKQTESNWSRNLILLVDRETGNVGEIIAAVLKRKTNPLIIGENTPGLTVEYRDVPIGEDRIMRYAIAEVVLDDDSSIFRTGIQPDIITPTEVESKHAIFEATQSGDPLTGFLYQEQRPRMNEAALVAGIDPEIDYYILRSNGEPTPWDTPPLQDRALQQSVDLLNASSFLESGRKTRR
ncbi:MAG: S41 family peptidase [Verrucomicrobiota bacterium]